MAGNLICFREGEPFSEDGLHKSLDALKLCKQFKKIDVPKYVPSEEELQSDQEAQREAQSAAMEKQNAQEQVALAAGQGS